MSKPRKPEVTSAAVAAIAGRVLAIKRYTPKFIVVGTEKRAREVLKHYDTLIPIVWSDIRALAASCLTQTAPKWPALPVKAAPRLKRGPGAKPLGKFKRRVNLRVRPRPSK